MLYFKQIELKFIPPHDFKSAWAPKAGRKKIFSKARAQSNASEYLLSG